ncbi:MAG: tyrosine-type recombinase/integrase [Chloroflexi bacterium]|nr:tyrosine-type recombinase/integrase [Chloroflexota bacterium]
MSSHNPKNPNTLKALLPAYGLCARAEGKSHHTITITLSSAIYLERFLRQRRLPTRVDAITPQELRAFFIYLADKPSYEGHPYTPTQDRKLSGHTINAYGRGLQTFFNWLMAEDFITENPFHRIKIPRAPQKLIPAFSESQLQQLFAVIDTGQPIGYRNHTMLLVLLDTGLRVSELTGLCLSDVSIEQGTLRVWGKGNKERTVPLGRQSARQVWRYISHHRPRPAMARVDQVFLTRDGRPVTIDRVQMMMMRYGRQAGLRGVRCSPHTLRHTAAINFLRNGGDVFSLQRLLGHSSLEMTRRYCQVADSDVQRVHRSASPVDNLQLGAHPGAGSDQTRRFFRMADRAPGAKALERAAHDDRFQEILQGSAMRC